MTVKQLERKGAGFNMKAIDGARTSFLEIKSFALNNSQAITNESETRFQLIDRILIEVLGWPREVFRTEPPTESGYIDYLLTSGGRGVFVLEAKKIGFDLLSTKSQRYAFYKIGGAALNSAADGLVQAARYCFEKAVPFAAVTNGISWIGFRPMRTDGIPYKDGMAVVFPDLDAIEQRFAEFYDLFSQEGTLSKLYNIYLSREEGSALSGMEPLTSVVPEHDVYMLRKNDLARDLEEIFKEFFKNISGDGDNDLLVHCFVQTLESSEADRSLEKIARELVNTIQELRSAAGGELKQEIMSSVERQRGQTVLIVGNKGAGKSTFIDRFFKIVLDRQTRDKCLLIKVDLAEAPGGMEGIQAWLTDRLIQRIEASLYDGQHPDFNELMGIFFDHYQKWSVGEFKHLHDSDIDAFRIKFGEFVHDRRQKKPYEYMISVLKRALRQRKVMPCIVFDNADNFPSEFQDAVFQYAQSIFRAVFSFIVVPITDRTI